MNRLNWWWVLIIPVPLGLVAGMLTGAYVLNGPAPTPTPSPVTYEAACERIGEDSQGNSYYLCDPTTTTPTLEPGA